LSRATRFDGVADRLGPLAGAPLQRHETVPARRATAGGDALDLLLRLFPLQAEVDERTARAALPVDDLLATGVVEVSAGELRALLDLRPYCEPDGPPWWVVSDLGSGLDGRHRPLARDHVLGVGGASTTLAQLTVRSRAERVLDVGTGCGVQALHASRHSSVVVATDVSARALRLAGMTAELSDVPVDLRAGDLLRPVEGETFDLIVSNPPFVVGAPAGGARHTYRDAGLDLDGVGARLSGEAPGLLRPGGTFQMLANWVQLAGESWEERVAGWLPARGVDALVVQREVLDPAEYVATWLRDAGEEGSAGYVDDYDSWLGSLEDAGVQGIGFGLVNVRRTDGR
jgi:hypothetical protein